MPEHGQEDRFNALNDPSIFDDDVCRASKGHCGRPGCCENQPPRNHSPALKILPDLFHREDQ